MNLQKAQTSPYDWQRAVSNPALFAGRRDELARIEGEIVALTAKPPRGPIIAVTGVRRIGKTSLLYQVAEICKKVNIKSIRLNVEAYMIEDPWEFWKEIFSRFRSAFDGEEIPGNGQGNVGVVTATVQHSDEAQELLNRLRFDAEYRTRFELGRSKILSSNLVQHDLDTWRQYAMCKGYPAVLVMLDEAHRIERSTEIKQQLKSVLQELPTYGFVFSGEPELSQMFVNPSEPFYNQATVLSLSNFVAMDDIAECALLPLKDEERKLMSPMTMDYVVRLSQGKPNQIRLICDSIYKRYSSGLQEDLTITVDVLDDIVDNIAEAFQEHELRGKVETIRKLSSVDLEVLHNLNRYPNWSVEEIVDLDECFRGEVKSDLAIARRQRLMEEKRERFINMGIMAAVPGKCVLDGGEFVYLYLRFWHEIRKYGQLSQKLVIGKGPTTPFGEKCEKLVISFLLELGDSPELNRLIFHPTYREENIIGDIEKRFATLTSLMKGEEPVGANIKECIGECLRVSQILGKTGCYHVICLTVRNRDNPRELMQIELYFDVEKLRIVNLDSLVSLLEKQSEEARLFIGGYTDFTLDIPNLADLLRAIGVKNIDEMMQTMSAVPRWLLAAIQYIVETSESKQDSGDIHEQGEEDKDSDGWVELYGKGDIEGAKSKILQKMSESTDRQYTARLHNDLGYLVYNPKEPNTVEEARRNLQQALELHYSHLQITLLDLAVMHIDENNFQTAIDIIQDVLLLTTSRVQTSVTYLRLRLPENHLQMREKWEQRPANVLESSYINLAYAILRLRSSREALELLGKEALVLLPNSIRLKHAIARYYLHDKRADLADSIYDELSRKSIGDLGLENEIRLYSSKTRRGGKKHSSRTRRGKGR